MIKLSMLTRDAAGRTWNIGDRTQCTFTTRESGFDTCNFTLARQFGVGWDDIGLNNQVILKSPIGDVAWWGRIDSLDYDFGGIKVTAVGYWYSAYDLTVSGTVTGTTPEACIKTLLSTTYLLQISTTQTGIYTTGVTSYSYTTGNGGTDDIRVGDAILAICQAGDSSNNRVIPYVLDTQGADGKPLLSTKAVTTTSPTARYRVSRQNVASMSVKSTLSLVKDRVIVRYKDSTTGALTRVTVNDTTVQANLGLDFTGAAGTTNYIRSEVLDISGFSTGTTSTIATATANARLNEAKRVRRVASKALVIRQDYTVLDTTEGQEIPLWKVRAGNWIQIPDLYPRGNPTGSGTGAGDFALDTTFYIVSTSYNVETGELQITPDQSTGASEVMAR